MSRALATVRLRAVRRAYCAVGPSTGPRAARYATALAILASRLVLAGEAEPSDAAGREEEARRLPVALVRGTFAEKEDAQGEGPAAARAFEVVARALERGGVPFDRVSDEEAASGALEGRRLAVLAYSPALAPGEREALARFVGKSAGGGGRLVVFYAVDRALWRPLGIGAGWVRPRRRRGEFEEIRFAPDALEFAPGTVRQSSWNVLEVKPTRAGRVLARWHDDAEGRPGPPAVVAGPAGAVVTHVMLGPVSGRKARMMLALAAGFGGPAVTEPVARARLAEARNVKAWRGLAGLAELARALGEPGPGRVRLMATLEEAERAEREATSALEVGAFTEALRASLLAEARAREAAALATPARDGEIRAVWVRRPEEVDWPEVAPRLGEAGFNVVFPNYLRGMLAAYDSKVMHARPPAKAAGSLAACIAACRRAGVEVHVWWTALFLDDTPDGRVAEFARDARLVVTSGGVLDEPGRAWLCPANPANVSLAREAAAELASRFGPDGVHLDYVRLPSEQACVCANCAEAFGRSKLWPGDALPGGVRWAEFRAFRRGSVTAMVEAAVGSARKARPGIYASAAVFPEPRICRETLAQDWLDWVERGVLDFVVPMDYTEDVDELGRMVRTQSRLVAGRSPLVPGIGLAAGRTRIDDPADLIRQIAVARASGADGFAIFQLGREFLGRHIGAVAAGPGRAGARVVPHGAPKLEFALPPGFDAESIPAGMALEVGIRVAGRTRSGLSVRGFGLPSDAASSSPGEGLPRVEIESASGKVLAELGPGPPPGGESRLPFVAPAGPFRVVVRGRVSTPERTGRLVAARSQVFVGLTAADLSAELARARPLGAGPAVAVLEGGYGSLGVLACLRRGAEFASYPAKTLACLSEEAPSAGAVQDGSGRSGRPGPPDVLVLTQRRIPSDLDGVSRAALRLFVEAGGGVLLTHDACGYRYHAALFPEITPGGTGRESSSAILPEPGGDLAAALGEGRVDHAHFDHILLEPGESGSVAARALPPEGEAGGEGDPPAGGAPVVVLGEVGKGRVAACGVALGIGPDERERAPTGREAELLHALVRYLAGMQD